MSGTGPAAISAGDLKWGTDVVFHDLSAAEDEEEIVRLSREKIVVVRTSEWRVIPLENLVARTGNVFVEVEDLAPAIDAGTLKPRRLCCPCRRWFRNQCRLRGSA